MKRLIDRNFFLKASPGHNIKNKCGIANGILQLNSPTYHAAKVAAHKDVIERGQLQVRGAQVAGQLQAFAVRHAAAPVRRAQRARARRAVV